MATVLEEYYVPFLALMPISYTAELGWVKLCSCLDKILLAEPETLHLVNKSIQMATQVVLVRTFIKL